MASNPGDPIHGALLKPKQTCAQCRARKVKCDGRLDFCANCERLGYDCSFHATSDSAGPFGGPSSSLASRTSKSRRVARACRECHVAKSRCTGTLPACQRCISKDVECVYQQRSSNGRRREHVSTSPAPPSSLGARSQEGMMMPQTADVEMASPYQMFDVTQTVNMNPGYHQQNPLLTRERVVPAIRNFFDHLHCLPSLAFLHRPSVMRLYRTQEVDPALLLAIVTVTSKLPGTTPEELSVGSRCADMLEDMLYGMLRQPSIFRLQALLLLLRYRLWTGIPNDALVLMAHLARSAFLMRLNYETFRLSSFVQESRRRLMWAIYMLDVSLADGLPEYTACSINNIHLRLPCMEDDFELDTDTMSERVNQTGGTASAWRLGIIGYYIRIVHLNDQALRYVKKLINLKTDPATEREFLRLEEDLEAFQARLPGHERFSHKSLALRAFSPRLARFVMTHVWWHVCHCQLFRCLLPTIPETFSQRLVDILGEAVVLAYQKKCLEHAISAVTIFSALMGLESDTCILDLDMAECAFKVAEILMLSNVAVQGQLGLGRAELHQHVTTCLRFAETMLEMYPAIAPLIADLNNALQAYANGDPCFALPGVPQTSPKQIISKHSVLYRATLTDDSYKLEIPSTPNVRAPNPGNVGRNTTLHDPSAAVYDGHSYGSYPGLADIGSGTQESQDAFPWPGGIPDIWDQVSLFRGPFDGGELEAHATDPG